MGVFVIQFVIQLGLYLFFSFLRVFDLGGLAGLVVYNRCYTACYTGV